MLSKIRDLMRMETTSPSWRACNTDKTAAVTTDATIVVTAGARSDGLCTARSAAAFADMAVGIGVAGESA